MAKIAIQVEHALGQQAAFERIRKAAEEHRDKVAGFVRELTWTSDSVRVQGQGFSGEIRVSERHVDVEADLGFPASLMPMKVRKEAEAWLRKVLEG